MKNLILILLALCIALNIHPSEALPQCCPSMCCSCGCGSGSASSPTLADEPDVGGDEELVRKRHSGWKKADIIINGVQAAADVGHLIMGAAGAASGS
ncbi:uncharacterized protein LOC134287424 [Aedes albopictus]|uniref:Secreted protein n=1 Tax=Aedes albopictus TaxID=7160 RepID=A0ABM2A4K2_AEDAL